MLYIKTFLLISGFISLLIGFYYNENLSGGAEFDHNYLLPFIQKFSVNFYGGLEFFFSDSGSLVHSPIFYIVTGNFLSFFDNLEYVKIFYIFLSCLLPLLFYQILKYQTKDNIFIFLFSLIIFFSPYFRSSAIWLLGDNLSLIFFSVSIIYYLKQQKTNKIFDCYLSIFFLGLCCYIRYYYFPFFFFYIFIYCQKYNYKEIFYLIIFSFLFSLPAIIYLIYVIKYHDFLMFLNLERGHSLQNYTTNFIIILTIILFYLMPFILIFYKNLINYFIKKKNRIFFLLLIFLSIYFVDLFIYEKLIFFRENSYGGGVFKKLVDKISVNNEFFMITIAFFGFLFFDFLSMDHRKQNYVLLGIIVLSLPFVYIFQKYLDPLIYLLVFGLIKSNHVIFLLSRLKNYLIFYYSYFILFFIITFVNY